MQPSEMFGAMVAQGDIVLDRLVELARSAPDKTFVYYGDEDRTVSYGAFLDLVDRLAAGLQSSGVDPDDRIAVFSKNALVTALAMFASWRAGAVYCPVNFLYKGRLLAQQLSDTRPKLVITDAAGLEALSAIDGDVALPRIILHQADGRADAALQIPCSLAPRIILLADVLARAAQCTPVSRDASDIANIIYTSGTTGASKGVVQPFRWINQYTFQYRQLLNSDDVLYCDLPLYHVGGAFFLVAKAVWLGASVALYDRFSPSKFWERIRKTGASHATLLDVMVPWLMSAEVRASDRENTLNKVHMQPLPLGHAAVARRFGFDFVTAGFGQTESGVSFMSLIEECGPEEGTPAAFWRGRDRDAIVAAARAHGMMLVDRNQTLAKGFMGRPSPLFEAAILAPDDSPCEDRAVGQLALRPRFPDLLLRSYFNRPEAMVKATANLWFHTGDACYRDATGTYFFVDRMGDVFRVRGENVSSFQVEDLLGSHPKIRAVAAVPIPAQEGDEEDCAVFVQLLEDASMTEVELMEHASAVMPKYMMPKYIRFVRELPLTPTNKVEKYKLKAALIAELAQAG